MVVNVCRCVLVTGSEKWHCSSVIVQINSHTLKILFNKKTSSFRQSMLYTPDISVKENTSLPLVWCCSYSKTPPLTLFNLHIPAVCSWVKTLWTQNTEILIKSLWIIRKRLFVLAVSHTGQIIRHEETWMNSVWIQNHRSWWNTINSCFYSDVHGSTTFNKFYKSDFIYIKKNIKCK